MIQKKTKTQNDLSHLKDAIYKTPPASATDWTGYSPYVSDSTEKSKNLSEMMNVPSSPPSKKK